jgi:predicted amidohydrolase
MTLIAAAIQMTSGDVVEENIAQLEPLLQQAIAQGAQFVATPENVFYMRCEGTAAMNDVPMAEHAGVRYAQSAAKAYSIWLLLGSIRAKEAGMEKPFNRSILIAPDGTIAATYDKIHLFDVTLPDGTSYRESAQAACGAQAVVANLPEWKLGMSICYDLRFPYLYQSLAGKGAAVLTVPSAFTRPTGEAHWHTLLRARAIENACYVVAPAQCGTHPGGRATYGHSLIIDPWGRIVAEASADTAEVIVATLDAAHVAAVRAQIPVLEHRQVVSET